MSNSAYTPFTVGFCGLKVAPIHQEIPGLDKIFLISHINPLGVGMEMFLKQLAGNSSLTANHCLQHYEHEKLFSFLLFQQLHLSTADVLERGND